MTTYTTWIDQWLQLDEKEVFKYCLSMSDDPLRTYWEFQKRSSLFYNYNGTPKADVEIPDAVKISPELESDREAITQECLKNKEVRKALNQLDIHRIPSKGLMAMITNAIIDLWYINNQYSKAKILSSDHTEEAKHEGSTYVRFVKSGAVGVLKEGTNPLTGKKLVDFYGTALTIVSGVGNNTEVGAYNSATYPGRCTSETGMIMAIVNKNPKVPLQGRVYIK